MLNKFDRETIQGLQAIVGADNLTQTAEELLCYSYDGTALEFPPAAVAFPGSAEEIGAIMRLANKLSFPVIPRGAGTGMTGGALAVRGGLVLALSRLNRILEIDVENQVAVVEPGVITGQFQEAVKQQGLFYPPDPASLKFCSLGGNVAECAGGPSAVKYGVTRDYILGLEVVLPDGRILATGVRTAKGVAGYDLTRLFVGSEGTLGVITKIIVSLRAAPQAKKTFLVECPSIERATGLVTGILATLRPCTLEYMDNTVIGMVSEALPFTLSDQTRALLLIEVDGEAAAVEQQAAALSDFLGDSPQVIAVHRASTPAEVESLWTARRAVSPAAFSLKPHKTSEDVVVPRSRIPDLVDFTQQLNESLEVIIFTFGHAGDGNIHVNIMLDREKPEEIKQAETAKRQLFDKVLSLGGTLSGEHGIGITKAAFLPLELGDTGMAVMGSIKKLFDPNNILNPGKIFPVDPDFSDTGTGKIY